MDVKVIQIDGGTNVEETMSKDSPQILKEWGEVLRKLLSNNSEKSRGHELQGRKNTQMEITGDRECYKCKKYRKERSSESSIGSVLG